MVMTFSRDRAALLSIQLLVMFQVQAALDAVPVSYTSIEASRGDAVTLMCNISRENAIQLSWTKDKFKFSHAITQNQNSSNFTPHRVRIEGQACSELTISDVQHEDAGLYICEVTAINKLKTMRWNLTVSEESEDNRELQESWELWELWYVRFILTPVTGFLLCGLVLSVCICRKIWSRSHKKDSNNSRTLSYVQFVHVSREFAHRDAAVVQNTPRTTSRDGQ